MVLPSVLSRPVRSVYQPIVDLREGAVVAVEALTRGAPGPLESPLALFEAAAQQGLLEAFDEVCLRAALLGATGVLHQTTVFVNIEPTTLAGMGVQQMAALARAVPARVHVVLEVTERALLQAPASLVRSVRRARELGWGVALDDVGADPAGLALLPFLSPDVIKLDLALIRGRTSVETAAVINAVRAEAERSGAVVLAEGIETEQHLERALGLGAHLGQGWRYGRPGPLPVEGMQALTLPAQAPSVEPGAADDGRRAPFDVIAAGSAVQRSTVPLVAAMSAQLEQQAMLLDGQAVVLGNWQHARMVGARTLRRYGALASVTALTAMIGPGMADEPAPGVRGASIRPDEPLTELWVVAVIAPHFAAVLAAREVAPAADAVRAAQEAGAQAAPAPRVMEYVLTYDRARALAAAHLLLQHVRPVAPAAQPAVAASPPTDGAAGLRQVPAQELPALLLRAMQTASNSIVITDARQDDQPLVYVNEAFLRLTGYREQEVLGRNCRFLQGPDTDPGQVRPLRRQILTGQRVSSVLLNYRRDGTPFWNEVHLSPVQDATGQVTHYIGNQRDVTERIEREQRMAFLAYQDELTGLPNRAHVLNHLELELHRARRSRSGVAVILLDLDGFKDVNDRLGHFAGDVALHAVAQRLKGAVRSGDLLGRLGGDEFLVVIAGLPPATVQPPAAVQRDPALRTVDLVAQHLEAALEAPVELDGARVRMAVSVGAALHAGDGESSAALVARADAAMYRAKKAPR